MKFRKNILPLILVMVLITGTLSVFTARAAGTFALSLSNHMNVQRGDIITVEVTAKNASEIRNFGFDVSFDSDFLEYIANSATPGADMPHPTFNAELKDSFIQINFEGDRRTNWDANECIAATLKFKIKNEDKVSDETQIELNNLFVRDSNGDNVPSTKQAGKIFINVPITDIIIEETSAQISEGGAYSVIYTVLPAGYNEVVNWKSSDETVATVSGGLITGVSIGTATITATAPCGSEAKITITVVSLSDSMLPQPEVSLISRDGKNVSTKIKLNIPGPYPVKWTAYSNDSYIYVTSWNSFEIAREVVDNTGGEQVELTIVCDTDKIPRGYYSGSITIVCGDKVEKLYVDFTKSVDGNFVLWGPDPFYSYKYRKDLAQDSAIAGWSSNTCEPDKPIELILDGISQGFGWYSAEGSYNPTTPSWVIIDLKKITKFDKFIACLEPVAWGRLKDFKIEASNNKNAKDDEWFLLGRAENNSQQYVHFDFEEVAFQYIRLYVYDPVQDHTFKNVSRLNAVKIYSSTLSAPYPNVEPTPVGVVGRVDLKIDATSGIIAKANAKFGAFNKEDVILKIDIFGSSNDKFIKTQNNLYNRMGYEPDFVMYDIYAKDLNSDEKAELLEGENIAFTLSIPAGFNPSVSKIFKVNENGSLDMLGADIEKTEEEIDGIEMEVAYMIFEMDKFGQYIIVEDIYDVSGGGSPMTGDAEPYILMFISILFASVLTLNISKLVKGAVNK